MINYHRMVRTFSQGTTPLP